MDANAATLLSAGGVSAGTIAILFAVYKILTKVINHRVRSNCCGKEAVVGVAVEQMTPHHSTTDLPKEEKNDAPV